MDKLSKLLIKNILYRLEIIGKNPFWLANETKINPSTLSRWLNSKRTPDLDSLDSIAKALGCTPADLITDSDSLEKSSLTSDLESKLERLTAILASEKTNSDPLTSAIMTKVASMTDEEKQDLLEDLDVKAEVRAEKPFHKNSDLKK